MKNDLKDQAIELLKQGVEISEITESLDVSQASVYRWRKEAEERGELEEFEDPIPPETELIDYHEDDTKPTTLLAGKKRRTLKKFQKLFKNLRLVVVGCRWAGNDIDDQIDKMDEIQDDIEEILKFDNERFEDNALWRSLEIFKERFEALRPLGRESIDLVFDYEEDRLYEIDQMISIDDFDLEFDWDAHEALEIERKKSQLMNGILGYEENSLNVESANRLISEIEKLEKNLTGLNGPVDDNLIDLLKHMATNLNELAVELEEAIFFKKGTLNIPSEVREQIQEHCTIDIDKLA